MFTALFTEHFPWAVSVATRFGVFDPELIAVEALRVAMVKYDSAEGGFRPFLNRVLFCGLAGAYRKEVKQRGLFVPFPEDFDPADETALAHLDRLEARDLLQAALPRLSPAQRQLLLWMYEDQLSLKEIAARL